MANDKKKEPGFGKLLAAEMVRLNNALSEAVRAKQQAVDAGNEKGATQLQASIDRLHQQIAAAKGGRVAVVSSDPGSMGIANPDRNRLVSEAAKRRVLDRL